TGGLLLAFVVPGEVGTNRIPASSAVSTLENHFAGGIKHIGVVGRNHDWFSPSQTIFHIFDAMARVIDGPDRDVLGLHRALVPPTHQASACTCIDDVGIAWIRHNVSALAASHIVPMLPADVAIVRPASNRDCRVVLLCAVNLIEELIVGGNVVELRRGLVVLRRPTLAPIHRDRGTAVVAVDHALRIGGVNPQFVVIAMRSRQKLHAFAPITRAEQPSVQHVNGVNAFGISKNVSKVPGPLGETLIAVDLRPTISTIIRAIEPAALLGFYQGIYTIGIAPGHGNPNSPHEPGWQSVAFEMFPSNASVYRSVEPTAGPTTVQAPRSSLRLIQRRK